jgi:nucleoside-diphosphate-sugar epimerase
MPKDSTIRAWVGGATGYTGREVARLLGERGIETDMHVRPDSSQLPRWTEYASNHGLLLDTTAWRAQAFQERFSQIKPTHVFGLLGTTKARAKRVGQAGGDSSLNTYETVDYGLTMELFEAGLKMATPPRFVYLSSAGSGENAKGDYLKVRHRIESSLAESYENYVSIRPSFITGAGRDDSRPMERIGATLSDGLLGTLGLLGGRRLRNRYRSITNVQLARAVIHFGLLDKDSAKIVEGESLHDV